MISDARRAFADFLKRELEAWKDAGKAKSEREWAAKVTLPPHDVRRARSGRNISLDKLQEFAVALNVEPWQLLFPGFIRGSPQFQTMSAEALSVALEVDRIEDEGRRRQVAAGILTMLGPPPPPAPAEPPRRATQSATTPSPTPRTANR